jgi:hypothetical protein
MTKHQPTLLSIYEFAEQGDEDLQPRAVTFVQLKVGVEDCDERTAYIL